MDTGSIKHLGVYPPLGVARVGNSLDADDFVVGPEVIGDCSRHPDGKPARLVGDFKTAEGRIKRQAARFRIYAHMKDGTAREVTSAHAEIIWKVAVANLKAGWYEFDRPMDLPRGQSNPAMRRNRQLRALPERLDIVPTPRSISGNAAGPIRLDDGCFWNRPVPLAELRTDSDGRLIFLGGSGAATAFRSKLDPLTFANNDGWHDDVCDGPIRATVTFPDGTRFEADPGFVAVTPPNFAPGVTGLVTMDDAIRETFQAQGWLDRPGSTSFARDVWPILQRLTDLQWVNHGLFIAHGYGSPLCARDPDILSRLRNGSSSNKDWRARVFGLFRDPSDDKFREPSLPQTYGDGVDTYFSDPRTADPLAYLSVTATQYQHLQRWSEGLADDWTDGPPTIPVFSELSSEEQIRHLERAALHDCLGGPFHPGIELTWILRVKTLWKGPYRLNVLESDDPARQDFGDMLTPDVCLGSGGPCDGVAAGSLTRFLGVPWQTDGASCNSAAEYLPTTFLSMPTFWGARVPDQVLSHESFQRAVDLDRGKADVQIGKHLNTRSDWLRDVRGHDYYDRIRTMVTDWWELGIVVPPETVPAHLPPDIRVEQGRTARAAGSDPKKSLIQAIESLDAPDGVRHAIDLRPAIVPPKIILRRGEV